jgi:hypothetical protein
MKDHKDFDCVQMKWDIQQHLLNEYRGMSREEARHAQQQRIAADPVLGPFLEKIALSSSTSVPLHERE